VECLAIIGLVLGMSVDVLQVHKAVRKLTLVAIFAFAILNKLSTQLCLVSAIVYLFLYLSIVSVIVVGRIGAI